jgi:branched-chain amino acid transport system substrate-binding protein
MSADLMIKGLEVAGTNPTRQSIVTNIRRVTDFNAGGLLLTPTNFTQFGTDPAVSCVYYTILKGSKFMTINGGKPFCSAKLPNSNQA